jgi:fucokinase
MAAKGTFSEKLRIYYGLARAAAKKQGDFRRGDDENDIQICFQTIQDEILDSVKQKLKKEKEHHAEKESVNVELPVRVNWGGGWTDTPPYCNEHGGVVLNAAISLKGKNPIRVSIRKLPEFVIELESQDIGAHEIFEDMSEVNTCSDPYDKFALHKAALIACGVIRLGDTRDLKQVLAQFGGGIYLSTQVIGVPKGSGLGTSSILSGACVKGLYEFFGEEVSDSALYDIVLCMEQLMSTGGGWQDQVGGITPGVKLITTRPGIEQKITVRQLDIPQETMEELQERFALIYTGQRRLARNLLRDVVGGYIGNRRESIEALDEMKRVAALMTFELEQGDIDAFAKLLNQHWKLSVQLDTGSTNTCIDQIFLSIEDLIDGKFISGAGGGGFLQVILKKGVTKQQLQKRLYSVFQDSGVDVWECAFV